jgi:type I restriction enzyme R subunit
MASTEDTVSRTKAHNEETFEIHVVTQLTSKQGYRERSDSDYNVELALDTELVIEFVKSTQPDVWRGLETKLGTKAGEMLCKEIDRTLKSQGTLNVLRNGVRFTWSGPIKLCHFKPASNINPNLDALYQSNILSVIRQVHYSSKNSNSIDVVTFVNGIPVATLELKNEMTGQTITNAKQQYKYDRKPAGEPLLTYKRGALVHIAVDTNEAAMTTKLNNGKTVFLPLNRGNNGRAGNPDIANEFKTAYLYATVDGQPAIFSREVILDIIANFMQEDKGFLVFPRFHQVDTVRKLLAHAKANNAGQNYLIQHSAGSGKTWTIAWTAAGLAKLHNAEDKNVFDSVIIISDRTVLDGQLQDAVRKLGIAKSYIETVDKTSRQLKEALENGKKIIVTTIQKFTTETIAQMTEMAGKKFAVIIDEAHGSQSGKAAEGLHRTLAQNEDEADEFESETDLVAEAIRKAQMDRQPSQNISYLAFTATPKNVTLERFGTRDSVDDFPHPFHLYTMRQAIEEGFILDVLQNYTTYKSYYELEKVIEDDPRFKGSKASRKVARYVSLTTVDQKAAVIVEHFKRHIQLSLNGQAKAMIVTQSREHAYRHYEAIKGYIKDNGYKNLDALIAFSGSLTVDGQSHTEAELNGFAENKLPGYFDTDAYQVLVVANKYQTGFDQPKICGMYIDRKLDGLQCVQTLTRANRTFEGKSAESIFIMDFQNTIEDIKEAFKPYFEATELESLTQPEQIYDLKNLIEKAGFIDTDSVDSFCEIFFQPELTTTDRAKLEGIINQTVNAYKTADVAAQSEFRQAVKSYCRFYNFIGQVFPIADADLERLYWYCDWLSKKLINTKQEDDFEITEEMVRLRKFRLEVTQKGSASPAVGETAPLQAITAFGVNSIPTEEEEVELSQIIRAFNDKHGTSFTEEDMIRFGQHASKVAEDMKSTIMNNPLDVALDSFADKLLDRMLEASQNNQAVDSIMTTDAESWRSIASLLLRHNKRRFMDGMEGRN